MSNWQSGTRQSTTSHPLLVCPNWCSSILFWINYSTRTGPDWTDSCRWYRHSARSDGEHRSDLSITNDSIVPTSPRYCKRQAKITTVHNRSNYLFRAKEIFSVRLGNRRHFFQWSYWTELNIGSGSVRMKCWRKRKGVIQQARMQGSSPNTHFEDTGS